MQGRTPAQLAATMGALRRTCTRMVEAAPTHPAGHYAAGEFAAQTLADAELAHMWVSALWKLVKHAQQGERVAFKVMGSSGWLSLTYIAPASRAVRRQSAWLQRAVLTWHGCCALCPHCRHFTRGYQLADAMRHAYFGATCRYQLARVTIHGGSGAIYTREAVEALLQQVGVGWAERGIIIIPPPGLALPCWLNWAGLGLGNRKRDPASDMRFAACALKTGMLPVLVVRVARSHGMALSCVAYLVVGYKIASCHIFAAGLQGEALEEHLAYLSEPKRAAVAQVCLSCGLGRNPVPSCTD